MYEVSEREKKKHANDRIQAKMFDDLNEKKESMESKSTKATKKNYDSIISMVRVLEV